MQSVISEKGDSPKADISGWNPEDEKQWLKGGKELAFRNLWISVPCLLCGFAVWMYWGVITVQMLNLGFPYSKEQLFTLMSIAGLSGATLRIPSTFLIRMAGGRNTIFFTTLLLIIPALGTGWALSDKSTPLWVFQILALLSGFGGGNFASSMSNMSFFFPKKMQGLSLGLNAGIGNFGVTTMQILVPLAMTFGLPGQKSMVLTAPSGTLIGKIPSGTETFIQNAGYVWALILIPLVVLAWFGMNNIRDEHVSPDIGSTPSAILKIAGMLSIGVITSLVGCYAMLPAKSSGLGINQWIVLPFVIGLTIFLLKLLPGKIKPMLERQYKIFENKHTWIMTIIYTMTFGSFIGYAAAFPLAIQVIFGFSHVPGVDGVMTHTTPNPNAPSALTYAWMGAFIGAFIRPIGGWLSDRLGGALVTQIASVVMVAATLGASYFLKLAYQSPTPEQYFVPFFLVFLTLFLASGAGNGSTFRSVAYIFNKEQAGPVLGWTSAVAAYGAFIIPRVIGEQIENGTPEFALYGFAAFYLLCVALNWWFYLRPGAEFKNP
ncbi:MAG: NarK/NasA family nitrate transporter [Candidatus Melainabacteria bacterium]|jgi:NNP family nitrate/nitrite transporter-like MFS transporter|nr:NarK/NasA family nitrate transporter [Candidatus Melainabacteria bacterium]